MIPELDAQNSLFCFSHFRIGEMKVAGIFANLSTATKESADFHTRQYVDGLAKRGVCWSFVLFGSSDAETVQKPLPGPVTTINSSKSFIALAVKSVWCSLSWFLTGRKTGTLLTFDANVKRAEPSLLFFDGLPLAPLVIAYANRPTILTCVDAMSLRHYRLLARAKGLKAKLNHAARAISCEVLERLFLRRFSAVHVVSDMDAIYLRRVSPKARIYAIPILAPLAPLSRTTIRKHYNEFVIWGDVGVPHIRDGILDFLNTVPQLVSDNEIRFVVLGRRAPDLTLESTIKKHPNVSFEQWLPDLNGQIARSGAVILPDDSGTGIKNRALHAMALGTVVIGSPSALEGILVEDKRDSFICGSADDYAAAIRRVCSILPEIADMERNALSLIETHYSDKAVSELWLALFQNAIELTSAKENKSL
jgi:glycosyltransferase involved in cell wall biosynthesis